MIRKILYVAVLVIVKEVSILYVAGLVIGVITREIRYCADFVRVAGAILNILYVDVVVIGEGVIRNILYTAVLVTVGDAPGTGVMVYCAVLVIVVGIARIILYVAGISGMPTGSHGVDPDAGPFIHPGSER